MISAGPVIPTIICVPLGVLAMITCAAHLMGPARHVAPASRRRIRQANGIIMLIATPLLTIGFGIIDPHANPDQWLITWVAAIALLAMAVGLAMLDVINTMRLHHLARRQLIKSMAQAKAQLREQYARPAPTASASEEPHERS